MDTDKIFAREQRRAILATLTEQQEEMLRHLVELSDGSEDEGIIGAELISREEFGGEEKVNELLADLQEREIIDGYIIPGEAHPIVDFHAAAWVEAQDEGSPDCFARARAWVRSLEHRPRTICGICEAATSSPRHLEHADLMARHFPALFGAALQAFKAVQAGTVNPKGGGALATILARAINDYIQDRKDGRFAQRQAEKEASR